MKKRISLAALAVVILTVLDQLVKYIIDKCFEVGESHPVIEGVFQITYVQNSGAAWGSFSGKRIFLLIFTFIILLCAVFLYLRLAGIPGRRYIPLRVSMVVLISGAIGNMIDRLFRGYVVDMFDFCLINFPVFNVADICVTCSFIAIVILSLFKYTDEEIVDVVRGNKKSKS